MRFFFKSFRHLHGVTAQLNSPFRDSHDLATKRLERRNRQIMVVVERRKSHHKAIAARFQITYDNLRQIISRWHRKCGLSQIKTSQIKNRQVH